MSATSYDFFDPKTPSFATIIEIVGVDDTIAPSQRRTLLSRLRQIVRWMEVTNRSPLPVDPHRIPFDESSIEAYARRFSAPVLGVAPKTLSNALADARFVLRHYGLVPARWVDPAPAWKALYDALPDGPDKWQLRRLVSFCSARGLAPPDVNQQLVPDFIAAMQADPRVKNWQTETRRALRAFSRAHSEVEGWPTTRLDMPRTRVIWGTPLTQFPPSLRLAIDGHLDPPPSNSLFADAGPRLTRSTIHTQREAFRIAASALVATGTSAETLASLRDVCAPEPFERILIFLADKHGGVTHWVAKVGTVLRKLALYGNCLSSDEVKAVRDLYSMLMSKHADWQKDQPEHRDQKLLDQLDNPALMQALKDLPLKVYAAVKDKPPNKAIAYTVQRALMLALWLSAPMRAADFRALRTESFFTVQINGVEYIGVRFVPGKQKGKKDRKEYLLSPAAAALLDAYMCHYHELIHPDTDFMFPGAAGREKTHQTLRVQMIGFIRKHLRLPGYHLHVIRKIVPKIILDADPTAKGIAKTVGGWKTEKTLEKHYQQAVNRAAQTKYLQLLEGGELNVARPYVKKRRIK